MPRRDEVLDTRLAQIPLRTVSYSCFLILTHSITPSLESSRPSKTSSLGLHPDWSRPIGGSLCRLLLVGWGRYKPASCVGQASSDAFGVASHASFVVGLRAKGWSTTGAGGSVEARRRHWSYPDIHSFFHLSHYLLLTCRLPISQGLNA
jgi:hypothetical protein